MENYKKAARDLVALYESAVLTLPLDNLGHFFARCYAVSGEDKYSNIISWNIYIRYFSKIEKYSKILQTGVFPRVEKRGLLEKKPRTKQRFSFYLAHPEIKLYEGLLLSLFYVHKYNLENKLAPALRQDLVRRLKKVNWLKLYDNEAAIRDDSSYLFNSVLFLKHLGINTSVAGTCEKRLQKMYLENNDLNKLSRAEYRSFIYSLTHIIIADSLYYARFVSGHKWIIDYFVNNIELITARTTVDILAEVAFCLKLCQADKKQKKLMTSLKKQLAEQINWKRLKQDKEFLRKKEHTNSLLIMLFSDNKTFFKAPKLDTYKIFNIYQD